MIFGGVGCGGGYGVECSVVDRVVYIATMRECVCIGA